VDDACPNERGFSNPDKAHHGCPKDVRVTTGEIVILRQVTFKLAQASLDQTVDPVSDDLLTEVRDVIQQHPEIETIEVQGHADDSGAAELNKQLSQQRADAVRKWLVSRGIDPKRLVPRGYGSSIPIASNTTDEGAAEEPPRPVRDHQDAHRQEVGRVRNGESPSAEAEGLCSFASLIFAWGGPHAILFLAPVFTRAPARENRRDPR
jgi:outer membrane protein OmpA-like peptidoglycan-associated protein